MRTVFEEPEWDYRTREVELAEFRAMREEYHSSYSHLISRFDPTYFSLTVSSFVIAILLPLGYHIWGIDYLAISPLLFGFSILAFGIVFFNFIIRLVPSATTPHFSVLEFESIEKYVSLLRNTPGVSWAGVQLMIGEASGYFSFHDIRVVGRLEAIESVAHIVLSKDKPSRQITIRAELKYDQSQEPLIVQSEAYDKDQLPELLRDLVVRAFKLYVEKKGHDPFVDEILAELSANPDDLKND